MDNPRKQYVIAIFDSKEEYKNRALPAEFIAYQHSTASVGTVIEYEAVDRLKEATIAETWRDLSLMSKVCKAVNEDIQRDAAIYLIEPTYAAVIPKPIPKR